MFLADLASTSVIVVAIILALIVIGAVIYATFNKKVDEDSKSYTRKNSKIITSITETGVLVAFAVVIEIVFKAIPFLQMSHGGSASLTMLPLFVLAYRRGVGFGVVGGVVFSLVNIILDGGVYHWGSIFLDYMIAFGALGIAGIFRKGAMGKNAIVYLLLGVFVGSFLRYISSGLSGVLLFGEYAKPGMSTFYYSFIFYNLPYMAISMVMCMICIVAIRRAIFLNMNN